MELTRNRLILIVLALAGITAYWIARGDSDEKQIARQMARLHKAIEVPPDERNLATLAKARELPGYFATNAVIQLQPLLSNRLRRSDLSPVSLQVRNTVDALDIRITDQTIDVVPSGQSATMHITARGTVTMEGRRNTHTHEFQLNWIKTENDWLVEEINLIQAIRPPR